MEFYSRRLKGICNWGDKVVEGRIILKYTLMGQGLNLWPLFIYLEFGGQWRVYVKMVTKLEVSLSVLVKLSNISER
jgi:hypothetical protein